jgi:hypothetical protein
MSGGTSARATVQRAFVGETDTRLRATWRFLLAWPLLPVVGLVAVIAQSAVGLPGMIPGGPVQAATFLVLLLGWARFVDRRPLSDYGVSASWRWFATLGVGFLAVLSVWGGWHALASALGWMQVEWTPTAPGRSLAFVLVGRWVSLALNTWVQDVVFFAVVLASAAEGLRSRGLGERRAVLGGWVVAVAFFTAIHGTPTVLDAAGTVVGGAVFGLLYVHTGDLAMTIGAHWGASYAAGTVFVAASSAGQAPSVFAVTKSLPAGVDGAAVLLYLASYVVLVGWLRVTRGEVTVDTGLVAWTPRDRGLLAVVRQATGD